MTVPPQSFPEPTPVVERRSRERSDDRRAHYDAIFSLARASEVHDEDTGAHVLRIRHIVQRIALQMNFAPDDAELLGVEAMLHDVGKLRVPVDVLKKPDAFTDRERSLMQTHTVRGARMLAGRPSMQRAARIARSHHEHWDGSGYPDGLAGEAIPLEARITAAADILDALIAARCYKHSWTYSDAMAEVISLAATKLDPAVVNALMECNARGTLSEIFGLATQCANP